MVLAPACNSAETFIAFVKELQFFKVYTNHFFPLCSNSISQNKLMEVKVVKTRGLLLPRYDKEWVYLFIYVHIYLCNQDRAATLQCMLPGESFSALDYLGAVRSVLSPLC